MENVDVLNLMLRLLKHTKKKGFKNNILQNDLKDTTLYVKPVRITEKQIKSSNLDNGRCRKRCYSSSFE